MLKKRRENPSLFYAQNIKTSPFLYAILTVRKQSADFFLQGGCNEKFLYSDGRVGVYRKKYLRGH